MATKRSRYLSMSTVLLLLVGPAIGHLRADLLLTAANVSYTDASGNFDVPAHDYWNTLGGDRGYNLWITSGGLNDPFVNGPSDGQASINIPLSAGTYTFSLFGEAGAFDGHHALNLFFNGDNTHPGISALAATRTGSSEPTFSANGGLTIANNGTSVNFPSLVPGAGTLSYSDGSTRVTLTDFSFATPGFYNADRVAAFSTTPSGLLDHVGQFSLTVSPVPEPSSFVLGTIGSMAALGYALLKRRQVAA